MSSITCSTQRMRLGALLLLLVVCGATGCQTKTPRKHWWEFWKPRNPETIIDDGTRFDPPVDPFPRMGTTSPLGGGEDIFDVDPEGHAIGIPTTDRPLAQDPDRPPVMISELPTIYFAYDSQELSESEMRLLDQCADWLLSRPGIMVQIEGHCDERGTQEYNLNLGQRRANAVREYLVSKGVNPSQMTTISYGEMHPIDPGQTEEAYAKNRRVQFLIFE